MIGLSGGASLKVRMAQVESLGGIPAGESLTSVVEIIFKKFDMEGKGFINSDELQAL